MSLSQLFLEVLGFATTPLMHCTQVSIPISTYTHIEVQAYWYALWAFYQKLE